MFFYIISPPYDTENFNENIFRKIVNIIPVKFFQFRPKHKELDNREKFVKKFHSPFLKICEEKKIKLIINDDFAIADKFYFHGIHLGQSDANCMDAKKKFGKNFIVGISCSDSIDYYKKAEENGADYVAFGPMYETMSKLKKVVKTKKIEALQKNVKLPFTLIGGINHKNINKLKKLKPNYVAIISSLWNFNHGPVKSALKFRESLEEIKNENDC